MAGIFISYRRDDSQHAADRLRATIREYLKDPAVEIFIDVDSVPFGVDFIEYLDGKVQQCSVLLALIGQNWLDSRDGATRQRRLEDPNDFVRIEIGAALKRGLRVVPLLLDDAAMPPSEQLPDDLKSLSRRNAAHIRRLNFEEDVARLMRGLGYVARSDEAGTPRKGHEGTSASASQHTADATSKKEVGVLRVVKGSGLRGTTVFVEEGERIKIGRNPFNNLVVQDPSASRLHCGVFAYAGKLYLEDYNSTNGTSLNGRRMRPAETAELENGDEVIVAGCVIQVQILAARNNVNSS